MKFKITMKDPDGVYESIQRAAKDSIGQPKFLSVDERDAIATSRQDELQDYIRKWIEYDEYITVEIDTEAGTATVCPA